MTETPLKTACEPTPSTIVPLLTVTDPDTIEIAPDVMETVPEDTDAVIVPLLTVIEPLTMLISVEP